MRKIPKLGLPLMLALLWMATGSATATTFLRLQSTCLGDGWFQYQMTVFNDPFFTEADIGGFSVMFTNQIDQSATSTNWVNSDGTNAFSAWTPTNGNPARPYTTTFLMRSSETSYKMVGWTNQDSAVFVFSLYLSEYFPGMGPGPVFSQNMVGYAGVPCLIPCGPEDADGSPTNFVYDLKLLPDVQINRLIQDGGVIEGVDFTYGYESTFLLQGSTDFNNWTNIAYIWSYPPETVWTAAGPLNGYGQFFRVAIVAGSHTSNLPPLSAALKIAPKQAVKTSLTTTALRVTGCELANGKLVVSLTANPGQAVQVQAVDSHWVVKQTQQIVAHGASATASFDAASLPNPVFFQAVAVQ